MGYWVDFVIFDGIFADFKDAEDAYNVIMVIVCVACAGIAAGLTVGLLSLDETKLEIKVMIGTEEEKKAAESILPIIRQHHLLLVTLLLFNSVANETLPIFLGTLVPNYIAIILSVTLVLIFGEIIPTALFTGANQLLVAAKLTKLVYILLFLFYPVSFPIAKLLDYFLGDEDEDKGISREELEALVVLQGADYRRLSRENSIMLPQTPTITDRSRSKYNSINEESQLLLRRDTNDGELTTSSSNPDSRKTEPSLKQDKINALSRYEVNLMTGILKLSKITVKDAMIPMRKVFMISSSTKLDEKNMYDILDSGFSRIPVFKRRDKQWILGYMLVKELIVLNPMDAVMIEDLSLREPLCVKPTLGLMDMLRSFQEGQCHFALVSVDPMRTLECIRNDERPTGMSIPLGIVTMEDILEMIIQSEIIDETDSIHTNAYLGKPISADSNKSSNATPTIFYHSLRRNSHSNLTYATGSYSGYNKTSKGGIRIQQASLRSKQKQASVIKRTNPLNYSSTNGNSNSNSNGPITRRPSVATLTSSTSVVEAECAPNTGRMVIDGTHLPSARRRSMSGATHAALPSPPSALALNRERSSSNFFTDLTSKFLNSLMSEDSYSQGAGIERPNVVHINKELQGLILRDLSGSITQPSELPSQKASTYQQQISLASPPANNDYDYYHDNTIDRNSEEDNDEEEQSVVCIATGNDRNNADSNYGFYDYDTSSDNNNNHNNAKTRLSPKIAPSSNSLKGFSPSKLPPMKEESSRLSSSWLEDTGLFPVIKETVQHTHSNTVRNSNGNHNLEDGEEHSNLLEKAHSSSRTPRGKPGKPFAHSQKSTTSNSNFNGETSKQDTDQGVFFSVPSIPLNNDHNNYNQTKDNTNRMPQASSRSSSISPTFTPRSGQQQPPVGKNRGNTNSNKSMSAKTALLIRDWDSFTF